jgi:transcriptional regulator with XRE-family HTH domain
MNTGFAHNRARERGQILDGGVGGLIAYWRHERKKSQLDLALDANVSQRHVSFVESGRANPSREMITSLAEALDVPLRERNVLLTAAGYAPLYRQNDLSGPQMSQVRKMLERILERQNPYPAVVMDSHWDILMTNKSAERFFGLFVNVESSNGPPNVLRMIFDPKGLRPFISNWEVTARGLIRRVYREAVCGSVDAATLELLEELFSYSDIPKHWRNADIESPLLPFLPVEFRKDDRKMNFFSTITTLGTPQDITSQEIRIECFFPADDETEKEATLLAAI